MRYIEKITPFLLLAVLSGCVTLPTGPSVNVLPATGKSFDSFRSEDAICRQWAEQQLGRPTQQTYESNVATGAVAGTAIGAGLGAALGSASGNAGAGAAIGAASGLLFGTAAGSGAGEVYGSEAQRRYDNVYMQCMYSYGNQLPGYRRAAPSVAVAPPPPPLAVSSDSENYPPPPEVYVDESPQFLYSPSLRMYVAVGVPYDLFYTGSEYYYFHGGRWYRGPYYNGPWAFAPARSHPSAFATYRIDDMRDFRQAEFSRYERNRAYYDGRLHRPEFRGERGRKGRR